MNSHAPGHNAELMGVSSRERVTSGGLGLQNSGSPKRKFQESQVEAGEAELDCQAFYELVRPLERCLFTAALGILGRQTEAEEIVQEAVVKAFQNMSAFPRQSKFRLWLLQIVISEAKMKLRNDHRTLYDLLEREETMDTDGHSPVNLAEWHEIPSSALNQPELRKALIKAVIALPPACRSVFILRDVQQISTHDAVMLLGLNEQTVKTRLSRARLQIREALAQGLGTSHSRPTEGEGASRPRSL